MASQNLGVIAYSIVNKKLEGKHYADPLYMMAVTTAEALAYREASISDFNIDTLKKAGLLKEM